MNPAPHPRCYWVEPGKLLAGTYPGEKDPAKARLKLANILDAGVRTFINLMEEDETSYDGAPFTPYAPIADELAAERGFTLTHHRFPIKDLNVPTPARMAEILDTLHAALANGGAVYLHCWGGHGRTGTVVGCHLIGAGRATPENFVAVIKELRAGVKEQRPSPETAAQEAFVRQYMRQAAPAPVPSRDDRYLGCLLGLAVGDAVGTTLEFKPAGTFTPITDMVGGGHWRLNPGEWTDDTSMALCLADSLLECRGFDPVDQLERYVRWRREGYLSSNGSAFDVGGTIGPALSRFVQTREPWCGPTDPDCAGNGSLMRLAPVPMYYAEDAQKAIEMAADSSRTTHGTRTVLDACRYFAGLLVGALHGVPKETLLSPRYCPVEGYWSEHPLCPEIDAIAAGSFKEKEPPEIKGKGYVVLSLEAALWAFHRGNTYREGCLLAANLGNDADTTAAIHGQIAGACYGVQNIPAEWRQRLVMRELIEDFALKLRPCQQ